MFSIPDRFLGDQWRKKIVRWLLQKLDLFEDKTLGDLNNLEGSLGKKSVFTFKNVGIKVDRLRLLANIPDRLELREAVIGTLTVNLPTSVLSSGSIEIVILDMRLSASLRPDEKSRTSTPRSRSPSPGSENELPLTAEELAQSFLREQTEEEKEQLKSIYEPMAASYTSNATTNSEEDDADVLGVGQIPGLPKMMENYFKGIADRLCVKVRQASLSFEAQLPEEQVKPGCSSNVKLELQVQDIDIEGVSRNITLARTGDEGMVREGKRRITLEEIRAFVSGEAGLFDTSETEGQVPVFGISSEATERGVEASFPSRTLSPRPGLIPDPRIEEVASTRDPTPRPSPPRQPSPTPTDPPPIPPQTSQDEEDERDLRESVYSETERFADMDMDDDSSDEEVLAFAPSLSRSVKSPTTSHSLYKSVYDGEDEDSEEDGGASFAPGFRRNSPSESMVSSVHTAVSDHTPLSHSPPYANTPSPRNSRSPSPTATMHSTYSDAPPLERSTSHSSGYSSSGDEMDAEASQLLSQSSLFTHEQAESLYMSATSGTLQSEIPERHDDIVGIEEVDERLDRLILSPPKSPERIPSPRPDTPPSIEQRPPTPDIAEEPVEDSHDDLDEETRQARRIVRKEILTLDLVTIFYPSLTDPEIFVDRYAERERERSGSPEQKRMPGEFSMYASRHGKSASFSAQQRAPKVKIVDDPIPAINPILESMLPDHRSKEESDKADIEILLSSLQGIVDDPIEKMLSAVWSLIKDAMKEGNAEVKRRRKDRTPKRKKTIRLLANEIDTRMIERVEGIFTDNNELDEPNRKIKIRCQLNEVDIFHKGLADDASSTNCAVKKLSVLDEEEGIITFVAPAPGSTAKTYPASARKRPGSSSLSARSSGPDHDVVIRVLQSSKKMRINVATRVLRVHADLKRLEEAFSAWGGFGSVVASTTASTATITKAAPWKKELYGHPPEPTINVKVDAKLGGLIFEVVGSESRLDLKTSPINIRSQTGSGVTVRIDEIALTAPERECPTATIKIKGIKMEFESHPTQDDLTRLLELLTPSKDRFDDDDILIDTLLRQREQGSVLRIHVDSANLDVADLGISDILKKLGEEIIRVLTATDFVAGDERPGLLTLINIGCLTTSVDVGKGIGRVDAEMENVGLMQITAPSLFASAIGTVSVLLRGEEILGEGLERHMFPSSDLDRPMLMVRMVGDEPEPVVKLKLWNFRIEYSVETLLALMEAPQDTTGEEVMQEVVQSIAQLPPRSDETVLGFDIVVKDCVLALNPYKMKSRGLIILSDAQLHAALPSDGNVRAGMEIRKASLMVIDDVEHLLTAERGQMRGRREVLSDHLTGFVSMGYVPVVSVSAAKAYLQVIDKGRKGQKTIDLELSDDLLLLESCADSTQTMIAILNGLRPPPQEKQEEIIYRTEVVPSDMFESFTEDAFGPSRPRQYDSGEDDDTDMVPDELPTNLSFVESYYGHHSEADSELSMDREELADSMLEEDLSALMDIPASSRQGSSGDSVFRERIEVICHEPLDFIEEHFGINSGRRQRSLKERAVHDAEYFPLRVRVRDVHIIWNLHDGYDWQRTRDAISQAVRGVEKRAAEKRERKDRRVVSFDVEDDDESVVDDFLFNSIYIGVPMNRDPKDLTADINRNFDDQMSETSYVTSTVDSSRTPSSRGRGYSTSDGHSRKKLKLSRSRIHKLQIELKGVNVDFLLFPPDSGETQCSVDLKVRDLEIFDNVPTSTWRKFVTYCQDAGGREMGSSMLHIECLVVKPVPDLAASELVLKVDVLPLRLHVDQDTLDFLTRFFEFKDDTVATTPTSPSRPSEQQPFLQRVEVNAVRVKLDYKPKKIDYASLRSGHTTEFMNIFVLDGADMVLKRVILHGIAGFERMGKLLNSTWMPDIKETQLGDVLAGVAPVRSIVNLTRGFGDLVVVPMREYKKDGRVVRSLVKGVGGFVRNTTGELVRLGAKVAVGTQGFLENVEGGLQGEIIEIEEDEGEQKVVSLYADQPEGVVQGLRGASTSLRKNFQSARQAITRLPGEVTAESSAGGAARAIGRTAGPILIGPMRGVSEAISQTLMGVNNSLDPENRRRVGDKYKKH